MFVVFYRFCDKGVGVVATPIGFGIGILMTGGNVEEVHKIQVLIRDLLEECLRMCLGFLDAFFVFLCFFPRYFLRLLAWFWSDIWSGS